MRLLFFPFWRFAVFVFAATLPEVCGFEKRAIGLVPDVRYVKEVC
jgi:hypothetical protein